MRWFSLVVTCLFTAVLFIGGAGCTRDKKTAEGEGGKKLSVKAPGDTSVKQGDTASINVSITREKLNDPVDLKFTGLPEGVTIMENDMTIAKDATSAKYTLKAAPDAKEVTDHPVTVSGSAGGLKADATFKVTVKKKA